MAEPIIGPRGQPIGWTLTDEEAAEVARLSGGSIAGPQPSEVDHQVWQVPRGSIVVVRGDVDFGGDDDPSAVLAMGIREAVGHDEFVVVCLPADADLSVIHDPEAMRALTGLVAEHG